LSCIDVKLAPLDKTNWRSALKVKTTSAQLQYVADYEPVALVILSKSYVRAGNVDWYPFAITLNKSIVGVVAITYSANRCSIFHLVIDCLKQGQGLGKASVVKIVEHIRLTWPKCKTVKLTVHPNNEIAKTVYCSCGFIATGEIQDSEPVFELSL